MESTLIGKLNHGHHIIAAALFVASLILSAAMILSAELTKPERYEYHPGNTPGSYVIYDRESGRATAVEFNTKNPATSLTN